jgi:tRNA(Arg) A34 adenosine deaminase TadA
MHTVRAAIFNKKGRELAIAENNYIKSHPLQAKFAIKVGQPDRIYLHAELACLTKLKRKDKPYRILVERFKKDGSPGLAKPCAICDAALKAYGIKRVEYTT